MVPQAARDRQVLRFGVSAHEWCDTPPQRVASLADRWPLTPGEQLGSGTSRVIACLRADGTGAFLKLTPDPAVARAARGPADPHNRLVPALADASG